MDDELRFIDLLSTLTRHDVEFVVVGGVAAVLHGVPISTFDLDIVYHRTPENIERLVAGLRELNASYADPAGRRIVPDAEKLSTVDVNLLRTDRGPLDVLSRIGEGLTYPKLLDRSHEYRVAGLTLRVIGLETLIESKEFAGRDRDLAALPILRRTLKLKSSS